MVTKLFEVRDRMTSIPVMATLMTPSQRDLFIDEERYLLGRTGYMGTCPIIMLTRLTDQKTQIDFHEWCSGARTMPVAHEYLEQHFNELETGAVIDVEFILGETINPKVSERLT